MTYFSGWREGVASSVLWAVLPPYPKIRLGLEIDHVELDSLVKIHQAKNSTILAFDCHSSKENSTSREKCDSRPWWVSAQDDTRFATPVCFTLFWESFKNSKHTKICVTVSSIPNLMMILFQYFLQYQTNIEEFWSYLECWQKVGCSEKSFFL